MRYYRVSILYGHAGSGKGRPVTRYMKAHSLGDLMQSIHMMPGVKRSKPGLIQSLLEVSRDEYDAHTSPDTPFVPQSKEGEYVLQQMMMYRMRSNHRHRRRSRRSRQLVTV